MLKVPTFLVNKFGYRLAIYFNITRLASVTFLNVIDTYCSGTTALHWIVGKMEFK